MMYYHYGYGPGWGGFSVLEMIWHIIGIVIAVAIIVWLLRMITGRGRGRHMRGMWHAHSALELPNERYAKGEINKEEYEERKKALLS